MADEKERRTIRKTWKCDRCGSVFAPQGRVMHLEKCKGTGKPPSKPPPAEAIKRAPAPHTIVPNKRQLGLLD